MIVHFYFRNRLENNTEHWNTLLLSLRELVEWVIKKDTEISSFGPLGNDLVTLQKQQVYTIYFGTKYNTTLYYIL